MTSHFLGVVRDDGGQEFADGFEMHMCNGTTRFVATFEDTPDTGRYLSCVHCGSRSVGNYDSERDGGYK